MADIGTATSGQILQGGGTGSSPTFSTATYPSSTTSQQILYSTATNVVGQLTTANSALAATNSSGTLGMRLFSVVTQVFTSTGTYTPTAGMLYCVIECVGCGGGGGGVNTSSAGNAAAGAGGGAGGYARKAFSAATIGASQPVTVGNGGTAGSNAGGTGGTGGTVSVGTAGALLSCTGGVGGGGGAPASIQAATGGVGGVGSLGDFNCNGAPGGSSWADGNVAAGLAYAGYGAASFFGGGAPGTTSGAAAVTGTNGALYGGGASGASVGPNASNAAGGVGAKGIVVVTEYVIA